MARGFESKDVEFQQAEADRAKASRPTLGRGQREARDRRRSIGLTLSHVRAELSAATNPTHQTMLRQAIADLERQLGALD